jgi:hypothetical protein
VEENELLDRLRNYLITIDQEAMLIDPSHERLSDVRRANQTGPSPRGPYAVVYLLADKDSRDLDCETYEERTIAGVPRIVATKHRGKIWLFRIEVWASDSFHRAQYLCSSFRSNSVNNDLMPLVRRRVGDPERVPDLRRQTWEGRSQFEVELGGVRTDSFIIDVIESGSITMNKTTIPTMSTDVDYQKV